MHPLNFSQKKSIQRQANQQKSASVFMKRFFVAASGNAVNWCYATTAAKSVTAGYI